MRLVTVHQVGWFLDPRAEQLDEEAREAGVDVPIKGVRIYYADVEYDGKRERWRISRGDAERIVAAANPDEKRYSPGPVDSSPVFLHAVSIELPEPTEPLPPSPHVEVFSFPAGPHRAERI